MKMSIVFRKTCQFNASGAAFIIFTSCVALTMLIMNCTIIAPVSNSIRRRSQEIEKWPDLAWLLSYPNSGSEYATFLVESLSHTAGATNYGNEIGDRHREIPFVSRTPDGPFRYNILPLPASFILTKTHCQGYCLNCGMEKHMLQNTEFIDGCSAGHHLVGENKGVSRYDPNFGKKIVHLIRNPLDNIVARYNHQREVSRNFESDWMFNYGKKGFIMWCRQLDQRFSESDPRWVNDPNIRILADQIPCHGILSQYVIWHNSAFDLAKKNSIPQIVIHYKDFKENLEGVADTLLKFLDLPVVGETSPISFQTYPTYYTDNDRMVIAAFVQILSSPVTWQNLQIYFPDSNQELLQKFSPLSILASPISSPSSLVENVPVQNLAISQNVESVPDSLSIEGEKPPIIPSVEAEEPPIIPSVEEEKPPISHNNELPPTSKNNGNPMEITNLSGVASFGPRRPIPPKQDEEPVIDVEDLAINSEKVMTEPVQPMNQIEPDFEQESEKEESSESIEEEAYSGPWPKIAWLMSFTNHELSKIGWLINAVSNTAIATNYGNEIPPTVKIEDFAYSESGPFRVSPAPFPPDYIATKTTCVQAGVGIDSRQKFAVVTDNFIQQCTSGIATSNTGNKIVSYDAKEVKKIVHLVRNPYDNIVGLFHLAYRMNKSNKKWQHSYNAQGFKSWCDEIDLINAKMNHRYYTKDQFEVSKHVPCHAEFFKYVQWHNHVTDTTDKLDIPAFILDYDDVTPVLFEYLGLPVKHPHVKLERTTFPEYYTDSSMGNIAAFIKLLCNKKTCSILENFFPHK